MIGKRKVQLTVTRRCWQGCSALVSRYALLITHCSLLITLAGCAVVGDLRKPLTRTETDYYTVTQRDTTVRESVHNVPGVSSDSIRVFPNSRTRTVESNTGTWDSIAKRYYPDFLRAGGLEIAGLFGTTQLNGAGTGLFGLYSLFAADQIKDSTSFWNGGPMSKDKHLISGELIRFMPVEYRLRWFNDAPNWTLGWSAVELLAPDEDRNHHALLSIATNTYVRRRIFLRDQIPYLIFSPFLGMSIFPSAYVNTGAELQFGSLAGLNLRAYAGLASGFWWSSPSNGSTFTYLGLGVSVMDFTNRVEETEREWKDYVNNGINFNILEATIGSRSSSYQSAFSDTAGPIQSWQLKLANVEIPLAFSNYHFWAGTSLLNWMGFGFGEQGFSALPLRVGYRQYLFSESLMLEPFLELNYYPSQVINVGARFKIDLTTGASIGVTAGYATGSPGQFSPQIFNTSAPLDGSSFSTAYLGFSIFLGDWNYTPESVRESRAKEIPSTMK